MRRGLLALVALGLLGGCADVHDLYTKPVPARAQVVDPHRVYVCRTTDLVVANVSQCGDGGFSVLSAAGD